MLIQRNLKFIFVCGIFFVIILLSFVAYFFIGKKTQNPGSRNSSQNQQEGNFSNSMIVVNLNIDKKQSNPVNISDVQKKIAKSQISVDQAKRTSALYSEYKIVLLDNNNKALDFYNFDIPAASYSDNKLFDKTATTHEININQTTQVLPYTNGATKIQLVKNSDNSLVEEESIPKDFSNNITSTPYSPSLTSAGDQITITVVSSGFTGSEMPKFRQIVTDIKNTVLSYRPVDEFASYFNFVPVETQENMECRREAAPGDLPGQERCAVCNNTKVNSVITNAGYSPQGKIVVLNDPVWGGCASDGISAITSHPLSYLVAVHELGHSLFNLADEYSYGTDGPSNSARNSNCFAGVPPNLEWNGLIASDSYFKQCTYNNWYRSSQSSIMGDLSPYFNEVSKTLIRKKFGVLASGPDAPIPSDGASKPIDVACENNEIKITFHYIPSSDPKATRHEIRYFVKEEGKPNTEIQTILGKDGSASAVGFTKNKDVQWDIYTCNGNTCPSSKNGSYINNTGDPCKSGASPTPSVGAGTTTPGASTPTVDPSKPSPTPLPQCHNENDRKNFLCGTASKAELAGQKCTYTDKSKAFDSSCQAASGNTYCYECTVDSSGGIKNVCKENKEGKDQGDFEKYLEPRCGGEKYDYAKALKGEYKGPYSDVYKCSKGDATIEIQESDICTKAPWNLKTGAGTPTPTMSPLLLCPSDGNHACAQYSNCSDTASFPKAKTEGNAACTDFDPRKPFCCTKSTGGTTTTPTTGAATSPSPTTSGGGGTGSCSDKSKLENKCACNPTTDTCSAGLDCVTDWTGSLKHCVNYSTGKYCPAKTDTTPTEAACTGGSTTCQPGNPVETCSCPGTGYCGSAGGPAYTNWGCFTTSYDGTARCCPNSRRFACSDGTCKANLAACNASIPTATPNPATTGCAPANPSAPTTGYECPATNYGGCAGALTCQKEPNSKTGCMCKGSGASSPTATTAPTTAPTHAPTAPKCWTASTPTDLCYNSSGYQGSWQWQGDAADAANCNPADVNSHYYKCL